MLAKRLISNKFKPILDYIRLMQIYFSYLGHMLVNFRPMIASSDFFFFYTVGGPKYRKKYPDRNKSTMIPLTF